MVGVPGYRLGRIAKECVERRDNHARTRKRKPQPAKADLDALCAHGATLSQSAAKSHVAGASQD
jgi:hypothetical protein